MEKMGSRKGELVQMAPQGARMKIEYLIPVSYTHLDVYKRQLLSYEIYLLDMTAVVAGTQFRGQFESRLRNIIEEVKKAGNIILVIDEIHTIASAGDAEGGMNAGNILKPALSRGEIQVIGATTIEEYRKNIEKDAALERRFQTVLVEEPTIEDVYKRQDSYTSI